MKDNESISRRRVKAKPLHGKAHLLGVILQKTDGHKRITRGEKFTLIGGNEETHEVVAEGMVKTFEELGRKGKTLETADPREIKDLLQKNFSKK